MLSVRCSFKENEKRELNIKEKSEINLLSTGIFFFFFFPQNTTENKHMFLNQKCFQQGTVSTFSLMYYTFVAYYIMVYIKCTILLYQTKKKMAFIINMIHLVLLLCLKSQEQSNTLSHCFCLPLSHKFLIFMSSFSGIYYPKSSIGHLLSCFNQHITSHLLILILIRGPDIIGILVLA